MSPYGIDKDMGGDNKENDMWMEHCVEKVMRTGKDKGSAVAICKTSLKKARDNKAKAEILVSLILEENGEDI